MRRGRLQEGHGEFRLRLQMQRHMNFAQRIAARYAGRSPGWLRSLNMTLVCRLGIQSMVLRHWQRALFHLSPRINLSFVSGIPEGVFRPDRPAVSTTISPIRRVMNWLRSETYVKRVVRSIERETLVEHVTSRRRRIEADAGNGPDKPKQKPIMKVLRRERGLVTQKPDGPKAEVYEPIASPGRGYQRGSVMTPAATSSIDVNQLTDEVIRSIDRRIIARRERLGRV